MTILVQPNENSDAEPHLDGEDISVQPIHSDDEGEAAYLEQFAPGHGKKKSPAARLVEIATECYDFFEDADGGQIGLRKGGHVVRPLKGERGSVSRELGRLYRDETGQVPTSNALGEAVNVLGYYCQEGGKVRTHLRVARDGAEALYIDMGDLTEHVIRLTADGWEVLGADADIPVKFRRTVLTNPMPMPESGGDLELLWSHVNMHREQDRQVLRGWLVAAMLLADLPCPVLALLGEQGTAKTSAMRTVVSLIDPNAAPARAVPADAKSLTHACHGSRVSPFDNLSSIPRWMSDALCRAVTGDSIVEREYYTNSGIHVRTIKSVVCFTGIDVGVLAGDFAERCVWANLDVIPPSRRRSEADLGREWEVAYPKIVGGLLDLVVKTLGQLPNVALEERPRMADFAEVLCALDLALDANGLDHYLSSQESVAEDIVATDPFLIILTDTITSRWEGTAKELHTELPRQSDDKYAVTARGMSGKLKRVAPDLRKAGWSISEVKPDVMSKRASMWVIEPPATVGAPVPSPAVAAYLDAIATPRASAPSQPVEPIAPVPPLDYPGDPAAETTWNGLMPPLTPLPPTAGKAGDVAEVMVDPSPPKTVAPPREP